MSAKFKCSYCGVWSGENAGIPVIVSDSTNEVNMRWLAPQFQLQSSITYPTIDGSGWSHFRPPEDWDTVVIISPKEVRVRCPACKIAMKF